MQLGVKNELNIKCMTRDKKAMTLLNDIETKLTSDAHLRVTDIGLIPSEYAASAVIASEARDEMLARLEWMTLIPKVIVDMGCGVADLSQALQVRYPQAQVLALDHSEPMLQHANTRTLPSSGLQPFQSICGNALQLPLMSQSVNMLFANCLLPWCADIPQMQSMLLEWRRVMQANGLLMLTVLGLDTMCELNALVAREKMPLRIDMHDMGDLLLKQGFIDPVLDVDYYTLTYRDIKKMHQELRASGMLLADVDETTLATLPKTNDGEWSLTFEVIHAHAFTSHSTLTSEAEGVVRFPLSQLRRKGVKA